MASQRTDFERSMERLKLKYLDKLREARCMPHFMLVEAKELRR